jgi:hypothetical protein
MAHPGATILSVDGMAQRRPVPFRAPGTHCAIGKHQDDLDGGGAYDELVEASENRMHPIIGWLPTHRVASAMLRPPKESGRRVADA